MSLVRILKGIFAILIFAVNTVVSSLLLYPFLLFKILSPTKKMKEFFSNLMVSIGESWIAVNNINLDLTQNISWEIQGLEGLQKDRSYLILANHQSWMDIVILQYVLNRRIPFVRFFLKMELIYIPLLGGAWWALDFPFMKRYSLSEIRKNPERRREDFETARKAGIKFSQSSVSILSFIEGTRFTEEKHLTQKSPYTHLLNPKVGGLAAVLQGMGNHFYEVLDITIVYPEGVVSLMQAFMGKLQRIQVHIRHYPVPTELIKGDYFNDPEYRQGLQTWVRGIWSAKDQMISSLKK